MKAARLGYITLTSFRLSRKNQTLRVGSKLGPAVIGEVKASESQLEMHRQFLQLRCQATLFYAVIGRPGGATLRSFSDTIVSATARISSVGSTQSIGIELHRCDGQFSRCDPFPPVPPCT
jgi:hypothetical protein